MESESSSKFNFISKTDKKLADLLSKTIESERFDDNQKHQLGIILENALLIYTEFPNSGGEEKIYELVEKLVRGKKYRDRSMVLFSAWWSVHIVGGKMPDLYSLLNFVTCITDSDNEAFNYLRYEYEKTPTILKFEEIVCRKASFGEDVLDKRASCIIIESKRTFDFPQIHIYNFDYIRQNLSVQKIEKKMIEEVEGEDDEEILIKSEQIKPINLLRKEKKRNLCRHRSCTAPSEIEKKHHLGFCIGHKNWMNRLNSFLMSCCSSLGIKVEINVKERREYLFERLYPIIDKMEQKHKKVKYRDFQFLILIRRWKYLCRLYFTYFNFNPYLQEALSCIGDHIVLSKDDIILSFVTKKIIEGVIYHKDLADQKKILIQQQKEEEGGVLDGVITVAKGLVAAGILGLVDTSSFVTQVRPKGVVVDGISGTLMDWWRGEGTEIPYNPDEEEDDDGFGNVPLIIY